MTWVEVDPKYPDFQDALLVNEDTEEAIVVEQANDVDADTWQALLLPPDYDENPVPVTKITTGEPTPEAAHQRVDDYLDG